MQLWTGLVPIMAACLCQISQHGGPKSHSIVDESHSRDDESRMKPQVGPLPCNFEWTLEIKGCFQGVLKN